jgi:hypothetical protein
MGTHMINPPSPQTSRVDDAKKAQVFFERASTIVQTGSYDYAVGMYIQGILIDPEALDAYKALRQCAILRSARGGKDMSRLEKKRKLLKVSSTKNRLSNALTLVSYLPQNRDRIKEAADAARDIGLAAIAAWFDGLMA